MPEGIRIEGLPELRRVMNEVGSLRPVKRGIAKVAIHINRKIAIYPRQRPPVDPRRVYIRGSGTLYVPTGRLYETSEAHGRSWIAKSGLTGLRWTIGSDTTYGPFLQDERRQTFYHQTTGWKTTDTVVEAERETASRIVKVEVDVALAKASK